MNSYSNELFTILPNAPFFLKHVVMINYAGKTFCVVRGIEIALESDNFWERGLFVTYALFMLLGQYWYTKFWLHKKDIESYYYDKTKHVLARTSTFYITLGAALYYWFFAILFFWDYSQYGTSSACSFGLWNVWCCCNLLLATPCFSKQSPPI